MRKYVFLLCAVTTALTASAQKKVLDHSVYDEWQSIGEKQISNDGQVAVYTIVPQEGDGQLWIRNFLKEQNRWDTVTIIPRGYQAKISNDAAFVVCKIKPLYQQIRQAKIQKVKSENMPKDSMAIINILTGQVTKIAAVQTFMLPEKGNGILVCLKENMPAHEPVASDSTTVLMQLKKKLNGTQKLEDSLKKQVRLLEEKGFQYFNTYSAKTSENSNKMNEPGVKTDLYIFHLPDMQPQVIPKVQHVQLSKSGNTIAYDHWMASENFAVYWYQTTYRQSNSIAQHLHEINGLTIDDQDTQLAFVAEKDSSSKALQRFFNLYYYK